MKKNVLITGATSGIGNSTARELASQGHHLIICGRRTEQLEAFKQEFPEATIQFLQFDIRDFNQVKKAMDSLKVDQIDVLINNAGNAIGLDLFQDAMLEDFENMIDLNVKGLLYVTKLIVPKMLKSGGGHIINIGSTAGKEVYPKGNVYCASKFAVDAISRALRIDLNGKNIRVSNISPGMVETEFSKVRFKGDEQRAQKVYEGFKPLTPKDIAQIISFVIQLPNHVTIADLTVLPTAQATSAIISKDL